MNRKKQKRLAGILKMLLPMVLFAVLNLWILSGLRELKDHESFLCLSYPMSGAGETVFEQWREHEGGRAAAEAALWKACGEETISSPVTGRSRKVCCYKVKGQPGAIFAEELMRGRYFTEGEEKVCLLDKDTVWELFGSHKAEGLEVLSDSRTTLKVAGILDEGDPLIILPGGEETAYDAVAVRKRDKDLSSNLTASGLKSAMGATDGQEIDGKLCYVTSCLLYAAMLALTLLCLAVKTRRIQMPVNCISLLFAGGAVLILMAGAAFASPGSDYLPAYWSDFDFFSSLIKEKAAQLGKLASHQEFTVWQRMFLTWQKTVYGELFLGAAGIIITSVGGRGFELRAGAV